MRVDDDEHERVFLVMAGTGFDAAIMQNTPEALKGRVGPLAYVISGLRAMRGRRTRVALTFDDGPPLRGQTRTVVVGNSGTLLGGLVLMPRRTSTTACSTSSTSRRGAWSAGSRWPFG